MSSSEESSSPSPPSSVLSPNISQTPQAISPDFFPTGSKALSGIALRAASLGAVFSWSLSSSVYLYVHDLPFQLPLFFALLALFHYLEFWTTAQYNTPNAKISSFLLASNGNAYTFAHTFATIEYLITLYLFPASKAPPTSLTSTSGLILLFSAVLLAGGQITRTLAMSHAGTSFNHTVQRSRKSDHRLVTTGIYSYLRHPSYFGYFWWALGTQIMLGNVVATVGFAIVLWRFFSGRIQVEEDYLVRFFGSAYIGYRKKTGVWIPGIN